MFNPSIEKGKIISRRAILLSAGKIAALSVLGARMYYLQIKEGKKYKDLAEGNRVKLVPVLPRRGVIKDRNDQVIAEGIPRYQLTYTPPRGVDPKVNLMKIAKLINLPQEKLSELLNSLESRSVRYPLIIDNYLSWENIARVKVRERDYDGFDISFIESRFYPYGNITSHITGYTGIVNKQEQDSKENQEKYGELLKEQNFRLGKSGIELSMQDRLSGKPGITEIEVDSRGRAIREISFKKDERGNDLKLTIDLDLQAYLNSLLKGKGGIAGEAGSAVLLDIDSGDVLAIASVPDFDANMFIKGMSQKDINSIYQNPDKPLLNKAISRTYPAGSTFKSIVATAALNENVINRSTSVYCSGHITFGGRQFHCWKPEGHGSVTVEHALEQSCNVFFYETARILGIEKIAKYARLLGLGAKTGIELPYEEAGIIPDPEWKRKTMNQPWYEGETLNTGIGQGYVEITAMQLATAAARIASGRKVIPHLVANEAGKYRPFDYIPEIRIGNLQIVQSGMAQVVNSPFGTAARSVIDDDRFRFAGKTGSAQYKAVDRNVKKKDSDTHSLFYGYAPIYKPKFAVGVIVEFAGGGAKTAAPIASQILRFAQEKYYAG